MERYTRNNNTRISLFFEYILFFFFLLLNISSCATKQQEQMLAQDIPYQQLLPSSFEYQDICPYIQYMFFQNKALMLSYHCVHIDMKTPAMQIETYPNTKTKMKEKKFFPKSTKSFARKSCATVAINASPFIIYLLKKKIYGSHIIGQQEFGTPIDDCACIDFCKENDVIVMQTHTRQDEPKSENLIYRFGGFSCVLQDNEILPSNVDVLDARTVIGTNDTNDEVFILCVEKNQRSQGLSYPQSAAVIQAMGATSAVQLDGGNSTSLCINAKEKVLCFPRHTVANSIGFVFKENAENRK